MAWPPIKLPSELGKFYGNFIGIIDMPEFSPRERCEILEWYTSGMRMIAHPQGQFVEKFGCNVLFVDSRKHLR